MSRAVVAALVVSIALLRGVDQGERQRDFNQWLLFRFAHFDSHLYGAVAERGYVADGPASHYNAFFPGLPAILRGWREVFGSDGRWGGLLAVLVASAVCAVVLGLLAVDITGRPEVGTWAVVALSVTPLTLFFSVVYTEAIFMGASVAAWFAARHGRWALAGTLALAACTMRLNGLFLVAALAVMFLVQDRHGTAERQPSRLLWLGLGPAFVVAWAAWLHSLTGEWNSWGAAQQAGWQRSLAWPWEAVSVGVSNVVNATSWHLGISRAMDLAALAVAVAATAFFVRRRDWPVVTLVGLNAVTVLFSSVIYSGPRFVLVWFPLYVVVADWLSRTTPSAAWSAVAASGTFAALFSVYWGAQWWIA